MSVPAVLSLISKGVPAYTNDDFSGSFPASHANDATVYGGQNYWRCAQTPVSNANSGTLIAPVYLAYDLSGVPSAQRQSVVLVWYNDPSTDQYNPTVLVVNYFNTPASYTIDTNTAAGGTLPTTGWVTQATITSQPYHSRQHTIALNGANWIRINVTAINGSVSNNNCAINMDVFDASTGNDNWIFFGDSITAQGLDHDDINITPGILPAQITAVKSSYTPLMENGGMGGFKASDVVAGNYLATWLPLFGGKYVGLNYGTNDANAGGSDTANFLSNMTTLVNAVITAGKIPVMHKTICYGTTAGIATNGPTINANLATLFTTFPSIIQGPDLWAYFQANQSLISGDGIHPTLYAGYIAYRQQWASALIANAYTAKAGQYLLGNHRSIGRIF